jgi:hypothetical protein
MVQIDTLAGDLDRLWRGRVIFDCHRQMGAPCDLTLDGMAVNRPMYIGQP